MTLREELVLLLGERTRPHRERRRERLKRVRPGVLLSAVTKAWNARNGAKHEPLTLEEFIVVHLGWLPQEREQFIQFFESKGHHKRCSHCGRGVVDDGPYSRCPACGSPGQSDVEAP